MTRHDSKPHHTSLQAQLNTVINQTPSHQETIHQEAKQAPTQQYMIIIAEYHDFSPQVVDNMWFICYHQLQKNGRFEHDG